MVLFRRLFLLALLFVFLAAAGLTVFALRPLTLRQSPLEFEIPSGLGLSAASRRMADAGLGFSGWQFSLLGRVLGRAADIKAGSYLVEPGVTPLGLLDKLTRGDVNQGEFALIEGRSLRQLRAQLDASPDVRHDSLGLSEAELLARIGASEKRGEGLLFPDTYLFSKQASDIDVLRRAYRAMQRHLDEEWAARSEGLPYRSPYEALIMASLIEKETGQAADRPQIAAVFINRLKAGMLLQTDPTVIYGLGERFDGNLRRADLLRDTPWNTYTRPGLPPTPIAMPGLASLRAVLHPPASDKYYFVARGDGSSAFSRTLEEHNRAVARYQLHKEKRKGKQ